MSMLRRLVLVALAGCLELALVPRAGAAETDPGASLVAAARAADEEGVRRLLWQGADPNAEDRVTPLMGVAASARRGAERLAVMRLLLAAGAQVNARNAEGRTALSFAAGFLDPDAMRLLLEHGADPNLTDHRGTSPLLHALLPYRGEATRLEVVNLLLGKGADVNARAPGDHRTALHQALRPGHASVVQALLQHGADPNARDDAGSTPLMYAVQRSYLTADTADIVRLLAKAGADLNAQDATGRTAVVLAAASGNREALPLLRVLGARDADEHIAKTGLDVAPALGQAIRGRRLAAARLLVAAGVGVNETDDRGWTPLVYAADAGEAQMVEALLAAGARVDTKADDGSTALMRAVRKRDIAIARRLLGAGAAVNATNKAGDTSLLIAAKFELMMVVARPGADSVQGGETPAGRGAVWTGGVTPMAPTFETIRDQEPELVAVLLDAGADPNVKDRDGLTPLMYAAGQGRLELVKLLLARGADVEAKNADGMTAWQLATGEEVLRALREARGKR